MQTFANYHQWIVQALNISIIIWGFFSPTCNNFVLNVDGSHDHSIHINWWKKFHAHKLPESLSFGLLGVTMQLALLLCGRLCNAHMNTACTPASDMPHVETCKMAGEELHRARLSHGAFRVRVWLCEPSWQTGWKSYFILEPKECFLVARWQTSTCMNIGHSSPSRHTALVSASQTCAWRTENHSEDRTHQEDFERSQK